jgi:hypothetical protein
MSFKPQHPLGPAFQKAREWPLAQQRLLTARQREVFAALKHRQTRERDLKEKRFEALRTELREREKNRKAKAELAFKPPARVFDPEMRRLARRAIASEKRLERLDVRHQAEAIKMLQKFELERAKDNANNLGNAWLKAVNRAATHEAARRQEKVKSKDFDRSR